MPDVITLQPERVWTQSETQRLSRAARVDRFGTVVPFFRMRGGSTIPQGASVSFSLLTAPSLTGNADEVERFLDVGVSVVFQGAVTEATPGATKGLPNQAVIRNHGAVLAWRVDVVGAASFIGDIVLVCRDR